MNDWFWAAYSRSYDALSIRYPPYQRLVSRVGEQVSLLGSHLKVLDAGCGTGNFAWELANRGHHVIGVDSDAAMLSRAKRKNGAAKHKPAFKPVDLNGVLPFDDGSFDVVVCVHVMYAVAAPQQLLSELRRVLKPSGTLLVVTSRETLRPYLALKEVVKEQGLIKGVATAVSLLGVVLFNFVINERSRTGMYTLLDEPELEDMLESSHFKTEAIERVYAHEGSILAVARTAERPESGPALADTASGPLGPDHFYRTLDDVYPSIYLTLLSIIQGIATGYFATVVGGVVAGLTFDARSLGESASSLLVALPVFLLIVYIWMSYLGAALVYQWEPDLIGSLLPFAIGVTEVIAIGLLGHPTRLLGVISVLCLLGWLEHKDMVANIHKRNWCEERFLQREIKDQTILLREMLTAAVVILAATVATFFAPPLGDRLVAGFTLTAVIAWLLRNQDWRWKRLLREYKTHFHRNDGTPNNGIRLTPLRGAADAKNVRRSRIKGG